MLLIIYNLLFVIKLQHAMENLEHVNVLLNKYSYLYLIKLQHAMVNLKYTFTHDENSSKIRTWQFQVGFKHLQIKGGIL